MQSISSLSKKLQYSPLTVQKRLKRLNKRTENPFFYHVSADINYHAIGLQLVDAYVELASISKYAIVENILSHYEYIKYIGRGIGIGSHTGFLAQFTIPKNTQILLKEFFDTLKSKGLIKEYNFYTKSKYLINKPPRLTAWDNRNLRWKLGSTTIEKWFEDIQYQPKKLPEIKTPSFEYQKMDKTHLIILEELTWDARRSDREIFAHRGGELKKDYEKPRTIDLRCNLELDVSYSTFARVMSKIDPNRSALMGYGDKKETDNTGIIDGYRLHYSPEAFSIFDTCVFLGHIEDRTKLSQFYNLIKDQDLGLRMSFTIYENKDFMWYLPMPSQFYTDFVNGLLDNVTEYFQLMWLNYGSTKNFAFWPPNYNLEKHEWKIDREWMVNGPLDQADIN